MPDKVRQTFLATMNGIIAAQGKMDLENQKDVYNYASIIEDVIAWHLHF